MTKEDTYPVIERAEAALRQDTTVSPLHQSLLRSDLRELIRLARSGASLRQGSTVVGVARAVSKAGGAADWKHALEVAEAALKAIGGGSGGR